MSYVIEVGHVGVILVVLFHVCHMSYHICRMHMYLVPYLWSRCAHVAWGAALQGLLSLPMVAPRVQHGGGQQVGARQQLRQLREGASLSHFMRFKAL